jgi:hypothetical protein
LDCKQAGHADGDVTVGERGGARRRHRQAGGGPKISTALRPPKANEFDIA